MAKNHKTAEFETDKANAGPFDPSKFQKRDVSKALEALASHPAYRADPFAAKRALNLMKQGIFRPKDIAEVVSV